MMHAASKMMMKFIVHSSLVKLNFLCGLEIICVNMKRRVKITVILSYEHKNQSNGGLITGAKDVS